MFLCFLISHASGKLGSFSSQLKHQIGNLLIDLLIITWLSLFDLLEKRHISLSRDIVELLSIACAVYKRNVIQGNIALV